jgi:hypothetical protein
MNYELKFVYFLTHVGWAFSCRLGWFHMGWAEILRNRNEPINVRYEFSSYLRVVFFMRIFAP